MLHRVTTAEEINKVVNHPDVIEWVRGHIVGPLDLTPVVEDKHNYVLMGKHGGMMFVHILPGLYEIHTNVVPEGRGKWALKMAWEALHWMFTHTDAVELLTRVPKGNLGARALVRATKGVFEFTNPNGWVNSGRVVPADIFSYKIQDWMRLAPDLEERGKWFHEELNKEFSTLGRHEPNHKDDLVHDRYVGVALDMAMNGLPYKALVFYNRWAKMAGYHDISIVTENPLVFDIGSAFLMVRNDNVRILACRLDWQ